MKVYKFGGASVKSAEAVRNVSRIIQSHVSEPLIVIVSAMHKTTNSLEEIVSLAYAGKSFEIELDKLVEFHGSIIDNLFTINYYQKPSKSEFKKLINERLNTIRPFDQTYDQVVSLGEIFSSQILSSYLSFLGITNSGVDARKLVRTDETYGEAKVNWEVTAENMKQLDPLTDSRIIISQGFIGGNEDGLTTTLGREGSDYTAAIFGACLNAQSVTIWKDVPGVMTADPKRIASATTFDELPFKEAAEMTYYGASVIHPKTIKPLANKGIPLFVKNFDDITLPGTKIHETKVDKLAPLVVFKENQCLISCHVTDYTFVDESQISIIFSALVSRGLKINLMQNSAISFSFCLDFREEKVMELIGELSKSFEVYYNTGLTLVTIKNYDNESFNKYRNHQGVIMEQSSRSTLQVLIK